MRVSLFVSVVVGIALLIAGPVPRARADARSEAIVLYQEGARAYKAGEYASALERFTRSNARLESASTVFNIAQCHRHLGNHAEAAASYRRYLQLKPAASDADEVRRLAAKEEELARPAPPPRPATPPLPPPTAPPPPVATPPSPNAVTAPPPVRTTEEHGNRSGLIVGVTVGCLLVVGLSLGVGLGVGLQARGPGTDLGTLRPVFN